MLGERGGEVVGGVAVGKEGLFGDFLFLLGQLHGYLYVGFLFGLLFLVGVLVSDPEEGPADRPDDEDYGQEEQDERAFAHGVPPVMWWMCAVGG